MIHQHYDPQQILWFLRNFWKFTREDLILEWHRQYDDTDFGKSQYQWLKSRYGMKGEWGAALNTPPYPGARPGGPGTENYEAPNVPVQPPRVAVRTQSRSPAPVLTNTTSGHDAVVAAFNAANARSGNINHGSSSSFHATASSMPQMPPAITEAALQAQSSAVRAAVAAAAAANQQGPPRSNRGHIGQAKLGQYNFGGGMTFPAPVSTGMSTSARTAAASRQALNAPNSFGQMAYVSTPAPAPVPTLPHQQAGYNTMPAMPFAPDFGDSMDAQTLFSSNMSHGYVPSSAPQFMGSAPATTGPSVFPTAPSDDDWMPSSLPGNGFMHLDGASQVSGQGLMMETAPMPATVPMTGKPCAPMVSSPIMIEDDVESVAPTSVRKLKQASQKRKRTNVEVNLQKPSAKRPMTEPTPRIVAAASFAKSSKGGRRGSKTDPKTPAQEHLSGVSSSASTPGSASTCVTDSAALVDTWFDGVHGNCMLNMRHKHFADGGIYLAPAGESAAPEASPCEIQDSSPVAEDPSTVEDPHAAMARLMAGLNETELQMIEIENSRVHITIPDSPIPTQALVEIAAPKAQLQPQRVNNTPDATSVTAQTGFRATCQTSKVCNANIFGITPPEDSCPLALPRDVNAVNAATSEFDPLAFLVESPESLPRPAEETLTNAPPLGATSVEPMLLAMQNTERLSMAAMSVVEAGASELDPDLEGFDTQGFINQLLLAGAPTDVPLYRMGSSDAGAEMPLGVDPMLTYSTDHAALEAAGMGGNQDHQ